MMAHFSIEIKRNWTDPVKMKWQDEANFVLQQVEEQKKEQRLQLECMVAQTEKIQNLETLLASV